jgi:hypothetical protein
LTSRYWQKTKGEDGVLGWNQNAQRLFHLTALNLKCIFIRTPNFDLFLTMKSLNATNKHSTTAILSP